jgi:hypothetical protein
MLLLIAGHLIIGGLSFHFFTLMLVPAGQRPGYLGIEWSLVFECTYYLALFLIALLSWHHYLNSIALLWLLMSRSRIVPLVEWRQPPISCLFDLAISR